MLLVLMIQTILRIVNANNFHIIHNKQLPLPLNVLEWMVNQKESLKIVGMIQIV